MLGKPWQKSILLLPVVIRSLTEQASSAIKRRPLPRTVSRPRASERLNCVAPSLARVASRPASPDIQQPFALRVEMEKLYDPLALQQVRRLVTTDEFIVRHAAVCQNDGSPGFDSYPRAIRQAWSEHHCIEKVTLKAHVIRSGAIIEGTWQGRDKINAARGATFKETALWNLDYHLHYRGFGRHPMVYVRGAVVRVLHRPNPLDAGRISTRLPDRILIFFHQQCMQPATVGAQHDEFESADGNRFTPFGEPAEFVQYQAAYGVVIHIT